MKKFIVLSVAVLALSACSSAEKKPMDKGADAKAATKEMKDDKKADTGAAAASTGGSKSSCTLDKDTRVIEVKKTESGGCELFYTKFGEAKSVASSGFGTQYCEEVKDRIQTNLNKAGFTCQ